MYRIGYLNANSLSDGKFAQAITLLDNHFDFLFIAEHWYQHHESRLSHPSVHSSTLVSSSRSVKGRSHGGIYLMATQSARLLIQSTISTEHSIVVSLPRFRFAGVYYPPYSLHHSALQENLNKIGSVDVLIGDINTRFSCKTSTGHKGSSIILPQRSQLFQSWAVTQDMIHLSNNPDHSTCDKIPDHAFSKISCQSSITLSLLPTHKLQFHTDHRFLLLLHVEKSYLNPFPGIASAVNATPIRFCIQKLQKPKIANSYRQAWSVIDQIHRFCPTSEAFDIDMLDAILCSSIQAIAETELGKYEPKQVRKETDTTAKHLIQRFDIPASIQLLKRAQRAAIALTPLISSSSHQTPIQECINYYQDIFHHVRNDPANQRHSTFDLSSSTIVTPESDPIFPSDINHSFPHLPDEETVLSSGLLTMLSPKRIKQKIEKMSSTSSCGSDGITVIMLRHLVDTTFPQVLSQLFTACVRSGKTPSRWNQALLYPIHKDRTQPFHASNSRPITLSCLFRKIFESLILPTITSSGNISYSPIQAGFRAGYSTLTNVLVLNHLIQKYPLSHLVFLDFKAAFDRVEWCYLKVQLQKQGMDPLLLQIVYHLMYHEMSYTLVVNGCQSGPQIRTRGLPQGSPLAPILFSRFINGLLQSLNCNSPPHSPSALFFADDGVLIAPTLRVAQQLVNCASSWADANGMSFNILKCGHLITGTPADNTTYSPISLNQQPIPHVISYKYLGVIIAEHGIDFLNQAEMLSTRMMKKINAMKWVSDTWAPRIRFNIFKVILSPTLEYSLSLLYAHHLHNLRHPSWKILERAYHAGIKWIAGGNANRPHLTCNLLGLLPFKDRAVHLFGRFYLHLIALHSDNPLRSILDSLNWYPQSRSRIRLTRHGPLLSQFINPPQCFSNSLLTLQNPPQSNLAHDLSLVLSQQKRNLIVNIRSKASKLIRITLLTDRLPGIDSDVVLISPAPRQLLFMAWRRGLFGWGRKCCCGERFDRGHTECMPYPEPLLTPDQQLLYNLDLYLLDDDIKYTTMDFLLNQQLWDKAYKLLSFWTLSMSKMLVADTANSPNT